MTQDSYPIPITLRLHSEVSLRGVTPRCHSEASLRDVTPRCHSEVSLRGVTPRCHSEVSLRGVTPRCHSETSLRGVTPRRHSDVGTAPPPDVFLFPLRLQNSQRLTICEMEIFADTQGWHLVAIGCGHYADKTQLRNRA